MFNDLITLAKPKTVIDKYGDTKTQETTRDVFAEYVSIGQNEFYQAAATGLKPEVRFRLADYYDYNDEPVVIHNGVRYRVLRTYRAGQRLELTVYREVNPA